MYKFTNGIVVFDKETRDNYIKAGMKLIEEEKKENGKVQDKPIEGEPEQIRQDVRRDKTTNKK